MPYLPWLLPHLVAPSSDGRTRVLTSGPRFGGAIHVVPRGLCQYSRKAMPRTDAKGREAARQQARFESRFANPQVITRAHRASASPGEVVVWSWDQARLAAPRAAQTPSGESLRALPETLVREKMNSGVRLVEGLDGYEGEIWFNGELIATRWWRDPPGEGAWSEFMVGARTQFPGANLWEMELPLTPPTPVQPRWRQDVAWADDNWRTAAARITPGRLAVIVGVVALAPTACQAARFTRLSAESQTLSAEVEEGRRSAGEWLAQRRRAQRDAQQVADSQALGDDVAVLYALSDLGAVLKDQGAAVSQVRLTDGEMVISLSGGSRGDMAALITRLEASLSWQDVRMEQGGAQIVGKIEASTGPAAEASQDPQPAAPAAPQSQTAPAPAGAGR